MDKKTEAIGKNATELNQLLPLWNEPLQNMEYENNSNLLSLKFCASAL